MPTIKSLSRRPENVFQNRFQHIAYELKSDVFGRLDELFMVGIKPAEIFHNIV